jgi:hypothetical protein
LQTVNIANHRTSAVLRTNAGHEGALPYHLGQTPLHVTTGLPSHVDAIANENAVD